MKFHQNLPAILTLWRSPLYLSYAESASPVKGLSKGSNTITILQWVIDTFLDEESSPSRIYYPPSLITQRYEWGRVIDAAWTKILRQEKCRWSILDNFSCIWSWYFFSMGKVQIKKGKHMSFLKCIVIKMITHVLVCVATSWLKMISKMRRYFSLVALYYC